MTYFSDNYNNIKYPLADGNNPGLRKAQLGAIQSISSHFTVSHKNAIVIMPTGTGKTAVLMMCPFVLKAKRVLVISPSKLVRNQIAKGFSALQPLTSMGVINSDPAILRIKEQKKVISSDQDWIDLEPFDIVVSTPNCVSPGIEGIAHSANDFFDLILIDEAHHTPAKSWNDILNHYNTSKAILFTATPFRRDKKDIPGKIVYNYPISLAYEEGIFGKMEFVPVEAEVGNDIAIALKCEEVFNAEPEGIVHYIMVRTDSKKRAHQLEEIYSANTSLRLKLVHSGLSAKYVDGTLSDLRNGNLDGIICVDMLGEGFDFPNLKIAAIHAPHKSLAATLQFIGRFTRTNAENVTYAKFIAIPEEIKIERHYLYRSSAIWRELIIDLSQTAIEEELNYRELIEGFEPNEDDTVEEYEELSLNAIEPYYHVKIYAINEGDFECDRPIDLTAFGLEIVFREDNLDENISVLILQDVASPKWSKGNLIQNVSNHLIITYFDADSSLLFINSTLKKSIELYDYVHDSYCIGSEINILSDTELNSVLANIDEAEFFNIGMRNRSHYGTNESYRIVSGPTAHNSISRSDVNSFHRGHLFGKGVEDNSRVTIGISSSSKVWSNKSSNLFLFLVWMRGLAHKINEGLDGRTNTPLDDLPTSITIDALPAKDVVAVNWHERVFKNFIKYEFRINDNIVSDELTNIQLKFNHANSDQENYRIELISGDFTLPIIFSFNYENYFTSENTDLSDNIKIKRTENDDGILIMDYLNANPLTFYYHDFSIVYNSYQYLSEPRNTQSIHADLLDDGIDWSINNVDIDNEVNGDRSIHHYFKNHLGNSGYPFVYYDHGTGEIADFISAELDDDEVLIKLYHCKGSGTQNPGNRVDDLYEVIGQGIKSLSYTNHSRLLQKLQKRQHGKVLNNGLCSDSYTQLRDFINNNRGLKVSFQIILVQPGITKGGIEDRISLLLSATNSNIRNTNNCRDIKVYTSA